MKLLMNGEEFEEWVSKYLRSLETSINQQLHDWSLLLIEELVQHITKLDTRLSTIESKIADWEEESLDKPEEYNP